MENPADTIQCEHCLSLGVKYGDDGYFYCTNCGAQAEGFRKTCVADEDFFDQTGNPSKGPYKYIRHIKTKPPSQLLDEDMSPAGYQPFRPTQNKTGLKLEDCYGVIRLRYVMGLQRMIQLQCEALVRDLKVNPLICGMMGPIWLRFVAGTQVFNDGTVQFDESHESSSGAKPYHDKHISSTSMENPDTIKCKNCENVGAENGKDGFFYCTNCHKQAEGFLDKDDVVAAEDLIDPTGNASASFNYQHFEFDESQETRRQGESPAGKLGTKCHAERRANFAKYDLQEVKAWFRSLRKMIPVSYTLAVSFLACHLARQPVLPTDIVRWSIEGKLPYFSAFLEIEKDLNQFGQLERTCPLSSSFMFKPSKSVGVQQLESLAASIAESVGLHLPPVNFYAIASRYLNKLSLPVEKILPRACRIYLWSMPPDLWLSKNESSDPTWVCVMSILIVAIRDLYDIHGFGVWERNLSSHDASSSAANQSGNLDNGAGKDSKSLPHRSCDLGTRLDTAELLSNLEGRYHEIDDTYEYCKDLPTYLPFSNDIIFPISESSLKESSHKDAKKEKQIERLWNLYQTVKDSDTAVEDDQNRSSDYEGCTIPSKKKKSSEETYHTEDKMNSDNGDDAYHTDDQMKSCNGDDVGNSSKIGQQLEANDRVLKDEAISRMKLDMEEKRFCYIPPRVNLKRFDYLQYVRKRDEGVLTYAAHADYYILLRVCAKVAEVEIRCMHRAVLSFERRLAWLEKRIDHCLHLTPPRVTCEYCGGKVPENTVDEECQSVSSEQPMQEEASGEVEGSKKKKTNGASKKGKKAAQS